MLGRSSVQERALGQATDWGTWQGDGPTASSGERVDASSALQLLTVFGCVRMITDSISTMPVDVFRDDATGMTSPIATPMWLSQPSVDLTFTAWCSQILSSLLLAGNAYFAVLRNDTNAIVGLLVFDPERVTVFREGGRKCYRINGMVFNGEMRHIKGIMMPGSDVGFSPIEAARQSIGLGLAAVKFGGHFFDGEGNMPGVIEHPGKLQPGTMKEQAELWRRRRNSRNRGLPGILAEGAAWKPTGVTNEQAQFLATRGFQAAEIAASMFLLDPSDLGIAVPGTSLTYANLEQRNARRVQVTLLPWIVRIEAALTDLLPRPHRMKFNVAGLLRGDLSTRYTSYEIGIRNAFLETDEVRAWENLPPKPPRDGGLLDTKGLADAIQKITAGVDVVLSGDEARTILNRDGAQLAGPSPAVPMPVGGP